MATAALLTSEVGPDLELTAFNRDEKFVARYFAVDIETVRGWRKKRTGPPWRKINGRLVRYSLGDLTAWTELQPRGG